MYHSNSQLTRYVGVNAQVHHIEEEERKINKSNMFTIMTNFLNNFISDIRNLWNTLTTFPRKGGGVFE